MKFRFAYLFIVLIFLFATACSFNGSPIQAPAQSEQQPTSGVSVGADTPAALSARQVLMQQLQTGEVEIVSVEAVDWPDACLGIQYPDVMCAQSVTPGYRVTLQANDQQYVYHTDADGSQVVVASAPEPQIGEVLVEWQGTADFGAGEFCQASEISADGVAFGVCNRPMMGGLFAYQERRAQLAHFVQTFAPFTADTPAGTVTLNGKGSQVAGPAEQRAVAEYARLVTLEANAGRSGASYGLLLSWSREGGFAGFCDNLEVYVTGVAYANNCKSGSAQTQPIFLTELQLEQLYAWHDQFAGFEIEQKDDAVADAMTLSMVFSGAGSEQPTEEQQQDILAFAQSIYAGFTPQ